MSVKIFVNKTEEKELDQKLIKIFVNKTLDKLWSINKIEAGLDVEISIALVDKDRIAELNQQYRQHNESTDVLSFGYENNKEQLEGEVVLCPEIIRENALEDKIEFEEELLKNIIHGVLHIVGYEHGEKMFNLQKNILKNK